MSGISQWGRKWEAPPWAGCTTSHATGNIVSNFLWLLYIPIEKTLPDSKEYRPVGAYPIGLGILRTWLYSQHVLITRNPTKSRPARSIRQSARNSYQIHFQLQIWLTRQSFPKMKTNLLSVFNLFVYINWLLINQNWVD